MDCVWVKVVKSLIIYSIKCILLWRSYKKKKKNIIPITFINILYLTVIYLLAMLLRIVYSHTQTHTQTHTHTPYTWSPF